MLLLTDVHRSFQLSSELRALLKAAHELLRQEITLTGMDVALCSTLELGLTPRAGQRVGSPKWESLSLLLRELCSSFQELCLQSGSGSLCCTFPFLCFKKFLLGAAFNYLFILPFFKVLECLLMHSSWPWLWGSWGIAPACSP